MVFRVLRHWLRTQRAKRISPAEALFWRLPRRVAGEAVGRVVNGLHRHALLRWHGDEHGKAIRAALAGGGPQPYFVVAVPNLLHFLVPCLQLATRHVPIVLVLNGTRGWEAQLLGESFPSVPIVRLRTLPGTVLPHGLVLDVLLRQADRDFGLHDPDLYVFDPGTYGELVLREEELTAAAFGFTNRKTALTFPTTHLLALRAGAVRSLMERHRIGPEVYRRTPRRLAGPLRSLGLGDHNFPKDYLTHYDPLNLLLAMAIHEGYRLRIIGRRDEEVFHVGGVSYLEENYALDYLHLRFLALPTAARFAERYRAGLIGSRSWEEARRRFHATGNEERLRWLDHLVDRLEAELARVGTC